MPALLIYLVKVNVALLVFCLGYYAVLRHLTFYTLNRAYLVTAILFSTLYPLINVTAFVNRHQEIARPIQVVVVNWQAPANTLVQSVSHHDKWYWLQMAFWIGVVILAIRLFMQLLSLYRLHRTSEPAQLKHYHIRVTKGNVNPFSFWRSIYVNPANHAPNELDAILAHEQIHVNEWHTLDILLGEISTVFYWFNPGIWLMKKAIRENIEFITDRKILLQGMDCKTYQYSLVNVSFETRHNAIVNHFNISTIKKRIMMMNAKQSSNANLGRYVFLIPVVVALLLVFSVSKAELHKAASSSKHLLTNIKTAVAKIDLPFKSATHKPAAISITASPIVPQQDTPKKHLNMIIKNAIVYTRADSSNNYNYSIFKNIRVKGSVASDSLRKYSNTLAGIHFKNNIVYNSVGQAEDITLKKNNIIVTTIPNRTFTLGNKIYMGNAIKDTAIGNSTSLKQLLSKIDTNQLQKVTKIKLNGKIMGKSQMDSLLHNMQGFKVDKDGNVTQNGASPDFKIDKNGTLTQNGQSISKIRLNGKNHLADGSNIDSLMHAMQGWKVDKDGTISKNGQVVNPDPHFIMNIITVPVNFDNKLIIIDGKEATSKELKKLSLDKIATVNAINPNRFNLAHDTILSKYGDKAKNGLVMITTKK